MLKFDKNKKIATIILLVFFAWGGVSYVWYTCGIKGFCERDKITIKIGIGNKMIEIIKNK